MESRHGPNTVEAQLLASARLSDDSQVDDISDRVTCMDIDSTMTPAATTPVTAPAPAPTRDGHPEEIDEYEIDAAGDADGGRGFCNSIFRAAPEPILPLPAAPPKKASSARAGRLWRAAISTHSSVRLVARPSPIPVAEHAERKLMQ